MRVIGLDIGGANLKASDGERLSVWRPFPLWQQPDRLGAAVQSLLCEFARPQHLAVTMTGELADCFETKSEGIERILDAVTAAADVPLHVWQTSGEFVSPEVAKSFPMLTAAANWHALATWAGRMMPQGCALLLDMGSTTTDIIPLIDGLPQPQGGTDVERLASGELVYSGCRRTPVCSVTDSVRLNDQEIPLAAEFFATMHDVALILGDAAEDAENRDTADGRPATIKPARCRIARMLCCDRTEVTDDELAEVANQLRDSQLSQLSQALNRVLNRLPAPPSALLLSGEGEPALRRVIESSPGLTAATTVGLNDALNPQHSTAACAYALARLGTERIR